MNENSSPKVHPFAPIRMKTRFLRMVGIFALGIFTTGVSQGQEAKSLVSKAEASQMKFASTATIRITSVRPTYTKVLDVKVWALNNSYALVQITAPERERGTAYVRAQNKMWSFLPKANKVIQLPSSMLMQGWMGSDMQMDNLLGEASYAQEYLLVYKGTEEANGRACHVIEATPKPGVPVVWSKVLLYIAKDAPDFVRIRYMDKRGNNAQRVDVLKHAVMDGVRMPVVLTITPSGKKQHTQVEIVAWKKNSSLTPSFFTPERLKSIPTL